MTHTWISDASLRQHQPVFDLDPEEPPPSQTELRQAEKEAEAVFERLLSGGEIAKIVHDPRMHRQSRRNTQYELIESLYKGMDLSPLPELLLERSLNDFIPDEILKYKREKEIELINNKRSVAIEIHKAFPAWSTVMVEARRKFARIWLEDTFGFASQATVDELAREKLE